MKMPKLLRRLERDTLAEVYYAGEYARDLVRRKKSNKVLAVVRNLQLSQILRYLKSNHVNSHIRKNKFIFFHLDGLEVELYLPKKEKKYNPFHPLKVDAKERGFIIHAMYIPVSSPNKVIDPYRGRNSIRSRKIKLIGNSMAGIKHQPHLMLEAMALTAELNYHLDKKLFSAIKIYARQIERVSINKIRNDFTRILLSGKPSRFLRMMYDSGLMHYVLPELSMCRGVTQNKKYHKYDVFDHCLVACDNTPPDIVLRLAALFHDIGKPQTRDIKTKDGIKRITFYNHEVVSSKIAKRVLKRLRFGKEITLAVSDLVYGHMYNYEEEKWTDSAVRRFIDKSQITEENLEDISEFPLFLVRKADRAANGMDLSEISRRQKAFEKRIRSVFEQSRVITAKDLDVNGNEIMEAFHLSPGPTVGHILQYLLSLVIERQELNKKEKLIELAREYLSSALK